MLVWESNRESATFRSLARRFTTELSLSVMCVNQEFCVNTSMQGRFEGSIHYDR